MRWIREALDNLIRVVRKVREVGFLYSLNLLVQRLVPVRMFSMTSLVIMNFQTRNARIESPVGHWATANELSVLTQFGHTERTVLDRLASGDRAWVYTESGRLLGYCWFTARRYIDDASGLEFPARLNEVWLYDAMVDREQRGRGIYPRILSSAARQLGTEGTSAIGIIVDKLNRNSIRAHAVGGAVVRQQVRALTILGRRYDHRSETE